ncbi:MAG: hypothetical protein M0P75_04955, partial [Candidatus Marinimicrobia bacterium]|nr:hypothetical protein [Candidatus Neomarinimicrobiota bacterium]
MQNDFLLIGIDGGATKVNGWSVVVEDNGKAFKLGNFNSIKSYSELPGYIRKFQPVDLNLQLKEWETGKIALTDEEVAQSNCYIEATTACISE